MCRCAIQNSKENVTVNDKTPKQDKDGKRHSKQESNSAGKNNLSRKKNGVIKKIQPSKNKTMMKRKKISTKSKALEHGSKDNLSGKNTQKPRNIKTGDRDPKKSFRGQQIGRKRSQQEALSSLSSSILHGSGDEEAVSGGSTVRSAPTNLKRVRSSWKMRPMMLDEKLRVFIEGRDEEFLHFDGGDFYDWVKDIESGLIDQAESSVYPLVVQDSEFRTVVEIKEPIAKPFRELKLEQKQNLHGTADSSGNKLKRPIKVPTFRLLPQEEWPETMLAQADTKIPIVHRVPWGGSIRCFVENLSTQSILMNNVVSSLRGWPEGEAKLARDPPFIRYIQPTPDELDLSVEYDLDEDDVVWLANYNQSVSKKGKKSKNAKRRKFSSGKQENEVLGEEWLEHLIDRLEKEYTLELQKHPEEWVTRNKNSSAQDGNRSTILNEDDTGRSAQGFGKINDNKHVPKITVPPIEHVLPFRKLMEIPILCDFEDETTLRSVYDYWRTKHHQVGRPLIQRLWYEPPWHRGSTKSRIEKSEPLLLRKKSMTPDTSAPSRTSSGRMQIQDMPRSLKSKEQEQEGVFVAPDYSPRALHGIRKRRMETHEVKNRFESIRRDLEGVRTLADMIRRREKLKRREMVIFAEEWQSRLKDITTGRNLSTMELDKTSHALLNPPPEVHAVKARRLNYRASNARSKAFLGLDLFDTNDVPTAAVDRAARLAARRSVRDAAIARAESSQFQKLKPSFTLNEGRKSSMRDQTAGRMAQATGKRVTYGGNASVQNPAYANFQGSATEGVSTDMLHLSPRSKTSKYSKARGSISVRDRARAQAATQPRSSYGRFMSFPIVEKQKVKVSDKPKNTSDLRRKKTDKRDSKSVAQRAPMSDQISNNADTGESDEISSAKDEDLRMRKTDKMPKHSRAVSKQANEKMSAIRQAPLVRDAARSAANGDQRQYSLRHSLEHKRETSRAADFENLDEISGTKGASRGRQQFLLKSRRSNTRKPAKSDSEKTTKETVIDMPKSKAKSSPKKANSEVKKSAAASPKHKGKSGKQPSNSKSRRKLPREVAALLS